MAPDRPAPGGPGDPREIEVQLAATRPSYHALVLERASGAAIPGARVQVTTSSGEILSALTSDAAGRFEVELEEGKNLTLRVEAPGHGRMLASLDGEHDTRERAQVFRLEAAGAIVGRAVDVDGRPAAGADVWCGATAGQLSPTPEPPWFERPEHGQGADWTATTDETGRFVLEELPAHALLNLVVARDDPAQCWSDWITLEPGEQRALEIQLAGAVTLHGSVVDEHGAPVGGAEVWFVRLERGRPFQERRFTRGLFATEPDQKVVAEGDGTFEAVVAPGSYLVGPAPAEDDDFAATLLGLPHSAPSGDPFVSVGERCEVPALPAEQELALHFMRGLELRGVVLDPDGQPVENAVVGAVEEKESASTAQSGSGGEFRIGSLIPGRYRVRASARGFLESLETEAMAGGDEVVLRLRPTAGSIRGIAPELTVRQRSASVQLVERNRPTFTWGTSLGETGVFTFDDLGPGTYDLILFDGDGHLGLVGGLSPAVDGKPIVVGLEPATRLRVSIDGSADLFYFYVCACRGDQRVALGGLVAGSSAVLQVPTGPLTLEWSRVDPAGSLLGPVGTREVVADPGRENETVLRAAAAQR